MEADTGILCFQRGPFLLGFLYTVLAEDALPRLDHRPDGVRCERLGNGDERRLFRRLLSVFPRRLDTVEHRMKPRNSIGRVHTLFRFSVHARHGFPVP